MSVEREWVGLEFDEMDALIVKTTKQAHEGYMTEHERFTKFAVYLALNTEKFLREKNAWRPG